MVAGYPGKCLADGREAIRQTTLRETSRQKVRIALLGSFLVARRIEEDRHDAAQGMPIDRGEIDRSWKSVLAED